MSTKNGYAALLTVIILSAAVLSIIFSVNSSSRITSDITLTTKDNYESLNALESCVEDALIKLNVDGSLPTDVQMPNYTCDVNLIENTGDTFRFRVSTTIYNSYKEIEIIAERTDTVYISKWEEIL